MTRGQSNVLVIGAFAAAHALVALLCGLWGLQDSFLLTILTITLTVIICVREGVSVEVTAVNIVLVNILGYALGIGVARLLGLFVSTELLARCLSTFLTTLVLGMSLLGLIALTRNESSPDLRMTPSQRRWLEAAIVVVLLARVVISHTLSLPIFGEVTIWEVLSIFMSNSFVLVMMILLTVVFMHFAQRRLHLNLSDSDPSTTTDTLFAIGAYILFILILCSLSALMVGYGIPFAFEDNFTFERFLVLFIIAILVEAVIFSLYYMIVYIAGTRRSYEIERERANRASYRYMSLKQQVDPHFLFNSLNILDGLVAEEKTLQARDYIRKLSGVYRYMLGKENESVVQLREEMRYAEMYADLLRVRFEDGFSFEAALPEEALDRYVVPSSIQMLLENAVKHNAISPSDPLRIKVEAILDDKGEPTAVVVSNNIIPRMTEVSSTGVGLNYIQRSYLDKGGKKVTINKGPTTYEVTIPLL